MADSGTGRTRGARFRLPRSPLWIAAAAVALPLAILLGLQLRTLAKLEETSAVAHRVTLRNHARAIQRNVDEFYQQKARDTLRVPASLLGAGRAAALAAHFEAQDGRGVRLFFVLSLAGPEAARTSFFDADGRPVEVARESAEARAVSFAAASWRELAREGEPLASLPTVVVEQDPEQRLMLRPLLDDRSRVVGVAGLLVDPAFMREELLPGLIEAEREAFPAPLRDELRVDLRPRSLPPAGAAPPSDEIEVPFKLLFTDQALGIRGYATPREWARRSLLLNLSLSLGMTGALVAAVVLALRSAARATALSQMKTEFVANVSHELRTPLASIRVFGEFLRLGRVEDPAKLREYGETIESESRRLGQLVDNILDFSKIESGQKAYRFEPTDLAELVARTLDSLEVRLEREGFAVEVHAPESLLPPVQADPAAIVQVLTNLLDNALKYSGSARTIEVGLARAAGQLRVSVTDRGPGIAAEEQQRIFEKFYRVGTGLVHDARGSGLGLAIVKHVVEAHGGQVEVHSRPGAGTTFTVALPVHDPRA